MIASNLCNKYNLSSFKKVKKTTKQKTITLIRTVIRNFKIWFKTAVRFPEKRPICQKF